MRSIVLPCLFLLSSLWSGCSDDQDVGRPDPLAGVSSTPLVRSSESEARALCQKSIEYADGRTTRDRTFIAGANCATLTATIPESCEPCLDLARSEQAPGDECAKAAEKLSTCQEDASVEDLSACLLEMTDSFVTWIDKFEGVAFDNLCSAKVDVSLGDRMPVPNGACQRLGDKCPAFRSYASSPPRPFQ